MSSPQQNVWLAKLAAWTHDPAEQALVLLTDPGGGDGGTVRALREQVFPEGIPAALAELLGHAGWWSSAADRPGFPRTHPGGPYAPWARVRFQERPVLIHPLSGQEFGLPPMQVPVEQVREACLRHFSALVHRIPDGGLDAAKTALAFWRFGPEPPRHRELDALWTLLPADTRVPDHALWSHLDLTAAFATGMAKDAGGRLALLSMSFGPVQEFIAQSRTTSDLWAGSHLLSSIAWEGLRTICEELGPDAVIYPQLRGVPLVDQWLRDTVGLEPGLFADLAWVRHGRTDSNPLFAASLPNKFVAVVPLDAAEALARRASDAVRAYVMETAKSMLGDLLRHAGIADDPGLYCYQQLRDQLAGFPEVHWASVPYGAWVQPAADGGVDAAGLHAAAGQLLGSTAGTFLESRAWKTLGRPLDVDGARFHRPSPGVLYPAAMELLENVAARTKSVREMPQRKPGGEQGYRCDLTGDAEWLSHDASLLAVPKGSRPAGTLWNLAARNTSSVGRKGEHLCAAAMLKRLWPSWFMARTSSGGTRRYVVSTHALALSAWMERMLQAPPASWPQAAVEELGVACADLGVQRAALPRRLVKRIDRASQENPALSDLLPRIPGLLDTLEDGPQDGRIVGALRKLYAGSRPEAYYGLVMLDGDRMGAWVSGADPDYQLSIEQGFHPQVREALGARFTGRELRDYLEAPRSASPSRSMAVSSALSSFALYMAREVVEEQCKGKLLYAGGDDVLAMVAVDDLLKCMTLLRAAYSGIALPEGLAGLMDVDGTRMRLGNGHAHYRGRLLRLMGRKATASLGAVVAHHTAPLGSVLRTLRDAEATSKAHGRDRFTLSLLKRAGGRTDLTLPWHGTTDTPFAAMELLADLSRNLALDTSRNAAYRTLDWVDHLPRLREADLVDLLATQLGAQWERQARGDDSGARVRARKLAELVVGEGRGHDRIVSRLKELLVTAEFLAREGRTAEARPS